MEAEAGKGSRRKSIYRKTEDGILHAVFEKDGKIWYVTEEKGDKENLTEYLKKLYKRRNLLDAAKVL